ncbi:hypothetical protein V8F20_004787 [Naviculisporaceae sp. PSN 640]
MSSNKQTTAPTNGGDYDSRDNWPTNRTNYGDSQPVFEGAYQLPQAPGPRSPLRGRLPHRQQPSPRPPAPAHVVTPPFGQAFEAYAHGVPPRYPNAPYYQIPTCPCPTSEGSRYQHGQTSMRPWSGAPPHQPYVPDTAADWTGGSYYDSGFRPEGSQHNHSAYPSPQPVYGQSHQDGRRYPQPAGHWPIPPPQPVEPGTWSGTFPSEWIRPPPRAYHPPCPEPRARPAQPAWPQYPEAPYRPPYMERPHPREQANRARSFSPPAEVNRTPIRDRNSPLRNRRILGGEYARRLEEGYNGPRGTHRSGQHKTQKPPSCKLCKKGHRKCGGPMPGQRDCAPCRRKNRVCVWEEEGDQVQRPDPPSTRPRPEDPRNRRWRDDEDDDHDRQGGAGRHLNLVQGASGGSIRVY